jgi:hypothetical protein
MESQERYMIAETMAPTPMGRNVRPTSPRLKEYMDVKIMGYDCR